MNTGTTGFITKITDVIGFTHAQNTTREKLKYSAIRAINQLLNIYCYESGNDPYSPHIIFDDSGKIKFISGDQTFSVIDLKSANSHDTEKSSQSKIQDIIQQDPLFFQELFGIKQGKDTVEDVIQYIKSIAHRHLKENKSDYESLGRIATTHYPVTQKLYQLMDDPKDYFTLSNNDRLVSLSESGKSYFSMILGEFFSKYYRQQTLGKQWDIIVFPNNIYYKHIELLRQGSELSEKEINELVGYLFDTSTSGLKTNVNYIIGHTFINDPVAARRAIRGHKSFIGNHLYGGLHMEQNYNYTKLIELTKSWIEHKDERQDDQFTVRDQKSLPSMSDKAIRSQKVYDMTRARTWVDPTLLKNENKVDTISSIFIKELNVLNDIFTKQGYTMNIKKLRLINKYPSIEKSEKNGIQAILNKHFMSNNDTIIEDSDSQLPNIAINNEYCTKVLNASAMQIVGIVNAFIKDTAKPGGDGDYADIKIKMDYDLINDNTGEVISPTGGYEHQIVDFTSTNEAGLSQHDIFFDPQKNIINQIREKGQINVDQFINSVHGGLELALSELYQYQQLLQKSNYSIYPKSYLQQQFTIKNKIPSEIIELSGLKGGITYTSIANDIDKKLLIEKAIEKYLLMKLFNEGTIHPYLYINNSDGQQAKILKEEKIKLKKSNYSIEFDVDEHVDRLLSNDEEYKKLYRICGGGSGNLTKTLMNATLSEKGYLGIQYQDGEKMMISYVKIPKMANILYHSVNFNEKKGIKVTNFMEELQSVLSPNEG